MTQLLSHKAPGWSQTASSSIGVREHKAHSILKLNKKKNFLKTKSLLRCEGVARTANPTVNQQLSRTFTQSRASLGPYEGKINQQLINNVSTVMIYIYIYIYLCPVCQKVEITDNRCSCVTVLPGPELGQRLGGVEETLRHRNEPLNSHIYSEAALIKVKNLE